MKRIIMIVIGLMFMGLGCVTAQMPGMPQGGKVNAGGFVSRNAKPGLGVLVHKGNAQIDIDIYQYKDGRYILNTNDAWIFDGKSWVLVFQPQAIHMEPNMYHMGCLKLSTGELKYYDTSNPKMWIGDGQETEWNVLPIDLPPGTYKLVVSSYAGRGPFHHALKKPYTTTLTIDNDPVDTLFGGHAIGWSKAFGISSKGRRGSFKKTINGNDILGKLF